MFLDTNETKDVVAMSLDTDETDDGETTFNEIDDFTKISQELKSALCWVLLPPIQQIILQFLDRTVLLKSSIDNESPMQVIAEYLAFRSPVFQARLTLNESIYSFAFSSNVIRLVIIYIHSHKLKPTYSVMKPLQSANMADNTKCMFDVWFANICDSKKGQLANVIKFANFLGIENLLVLLCAKMASKIRGVPIEKIEMAIDELFIDNNIPIPECTCGDH